MKKLCNWSRIQLPLISGYNDESIFLKGSSPQDIFILENKHSFQRKKYSFVSLNKEKIETFEMKVWLKMAEPIQHYWAICITKLNGMACFTISSGLYCIEWSSFAQLFILSFILAFCRKELDIQRSMMGCCMSFLGSTSNPGQTNTRHDKP